MKPYFQADGVVIYNGDCREVLADLEPLEADLLLTDPPYGQQFNGAGKTTKGANIRADGARQGVRVFRQVLGDVAPHLSADAHLYACCHWESWPDFYDAASSYTAIKSALIWWKNRGGMGDTEMEYARDYEVLLFAAQGRRTLAGRRDGALIEGIPPVGNERRHPTEKPLRLMSYLIGKSCPPGGLVIDPFAGVGPVGVAAREMGRRAVLIEIEERWCEIAANDLRQTVLQLPPQVSAKTEQGVLLLSSPEQINEALGAGTIMAEAATDLIK